MGQCDEGAPVPMSKLLEGLGYSDDFQAAMRSDEYQGRRAFSPWKLENRQATLRTSSILLDSGHAGATNYCVTTDTRHFARQSFVLTNQMPNPSRRSRAHFEGSLRIDGQTRIHAHQNSSLCLCRLGYCMSINHFNWTHIKLDS